MRRLSSVLPKGKPGEKAAGTDKFIQIPGILLKKDQKIPCLRAAGGPGAELYKIYIFAGTTEKNIDFSREKQYC